MIPSPILEQHLQRIAQQSVTVFVRSLQEHLQDIPKRYQVPSAQWEEYLERITFMIGGTQASRSVPLTLKALSAGVVLSWCQRDRRPSSVCHGSVRTEHGCGSSIPCLRGTGWVGGPAGCNHIV